MSRNHDYVDSSGWDRPYSDTKDGEVHPPAKERYVREDGTTPPPDPRYVRNALGEPRH
jgi:hypothetical protein